MRKLGNILWYFPFFGFIDAIGVFLLGSLLIVTVIGAPIGLGLIQYSRFLLAPFSSAMVAKSELSAEAGNKLWASYGMIIRIVYFPLGLLFALVTVFQIAALFCTIIGIPAAIILAKSISTYLNPVGKKCVPVAVTQELDRRKAQTQIDKHLTKPTLQNI